MDNFSPKPFLATVALASAVFYGLMLVIAQGVAHSDGHVGGLATSTTMSDFGWPRMYCVRSRFWTQPAYELFDTQYDWRYGALAVDVLASMVMIVAVYFVSGWLVARPVKGLRFTMRDLLWCVTVVCIIAATMRVFQQYPWRPPPGAVLVVTVGVTCTAVCLAAGLAGACAWIANRLSHQEARDLSNARDNPP